AARRRDCWTPASKIKYLFFSFISLFFFHSPPARERAAKSPEITAWSDLEDITRAAPMGFAFLLIINVLKIDPECRRRICDIPAL
ncbi:MAG: hypothetical protein LUQ08_06095, partial [Methanothrix sp.]|nr:hypothetical protein [Methanothrix sp.]